VLALGTRLDLADARRVGRVEAALLLYPQHVAPWLAVCERSWNAVTGESTTRAKPHSVAGAEGPQSDTRLSGANKPWLFGGLSAHCDASP
jgi:hypothetical protein